jgi:hypothetical protein
MRNEIGKKAAMFYRLVFGAFILSLPMSCAGLAQALNPLSTAELDEKFGPMELLFCFQGKGSCLPYDGGVLHEAYARIPAMRNGRTIVAGNSSGSIPAAYFGCFGLNDATVRHAEERLKLGNRGAVRNMESVSNKISKLSRGKSTEIQHIELREYVAFALGVQQWEDAQSIAAIVERSSAKPQYPCLIVACNKEVLEDRHPEQKLFAGRLKEIDYSNMQVSWKPEVFEYYQQHPDRFRRDHPLLFLGADRKIGRAMTFFVDQSMFDLLSRIPSNERLADLRLMTDASDVALAIIASVSEPSYFEPVIDPHPEKILADDGLSILKSVRQRTYYGGYIVSLPAQDVRRMLPGIRVLGSGWRHNPLVARKLLKNWLLADCEEIAFRSEWWADLEVNPDAEFESHIEFRDLSGEEEFQFGVRRAKELFDQDRGLPAFVKKPYFHYPASAAIAPHQAKGDMYVGEEANDATNRTLKTMRGMRPLLQPSGETP